jgi:hypothetical protein
MRPLVPEDRHRNGNRATDALVRAVITVADGKLNPDRVTSEFMTRRWGSEAAADVATVLRAASAPATTTNAGWAGLWATTVLSYLSNLIPYSAGADLLQRALVLTFDGANQISIPTVSAPLADFVQQGAPIPVVQAVSGIQTNLSPCKFAVITVLTREVVESGNAEALVKTALLESTGPALDRRLFDNVAATPDLRPAGLLNGKVALTASTNTDKYEAMVSDIATLAATVAPLAANGGIIFVAAPKQAVALNIGLPNFNYPILVSGSLADGTIIVVARNAVISAFDALPLIDTTKAATMHMDTAPQQLATGGTMASPTTVMFQTDKIGIRLRWPITWALRNANAIAFMTGLAWP